MNTELAWRECGWELYKSKAHSHVTTVFVLSAQPHYIHADLAKAKLGGGVKVYRKIMHLCLNMLFSSVYDQIQGLRKDKKEMTKVETL